MAMMRRVDTFICLYREIDRFIAQSIDNSIDPHKTFFANYHLPRLKQLLSSCLTWFTKP